jgi:hypothetical protein
VELPLVVALLAMIILVLTAGKLHLSTVCSFLLTVSYQIVCNVFNTDSEHCVEQICIPFTYVYQTIRRHLNSAAPPDHQVLHCPQ